MFYEGLRMKAEYENNNGFIEIRFDEVPPENIRASLKISGWKWNSKRFCWRNSYNSENLLFAKSLCDSESNKKNTRSAQVVNNASYYNAIVETICKYTNYEHKDIVVEKNYKDSCCNGIKLCYLNSMLYISDGNMEIKCDGHYCPRCHKLFFMRKKLNKSISLSNAYLLKTPFINVKVGFKQNGVWNELAPIRYDSDISYSKKYNKNIQLYLVMRAFIDGKEISTIYHILKKYGYYINVFNNLPVNDQVNSEIYKFYNVSSIENLCNVSPKNLSLKLHHIIENSDISKVYIADIDVGEKSLRFNYNISDNMKLVLSMKCSNVYKLFGEYRFDILNKSINAEFRCKNLSLVYNFVLKNDDAGYEMLTSKNEYKKLIENVSKGFLDNSNYYEENNVRLVNVADFLVRSTTYGCVNNKHNIIRINASVKVKSKNGIYEIIIPAAYCSKCDRYYILERYYESLKEYGYICCKVDKFEVIQKNSGSKFSTFQDKSILSLYGYNVNQQEGLSESERHKILDFVIDTGVLSCNQVINHLEQNISLRKNNNVMKNAIREWEKDIDYVRERESVAALIRVNSILVPVKRVVIK